MPTRRSFPWNIELAHQTAQLARVALVFLYWSFRLDGMANVLHSFHKPIASGALPPANRAPERLHQKGLVWEGDWLIACFCGQAIAIRVDGCSVRLAVVWAERNHLWWARHVDWCAQKLRDANLLWGVLLCSRKRSFSPHSDAWESVLQRSRWFENCAWHHGFGTLTEVESYSLIDQQFYLQAVLFV